MWPAIPSGSKVEVTPCSPSSIQPDDIVAYERKGAVVVHRLLQVQPSGLLCSGDFHQQGGEFVPLAQFLGRVQVLERRALNLRLPNRAEVASLLWVTVRRLNAQLVQLRGRRGAHSEKKEEL